MSPEFMAGERVITIHLICTECGKPAQGNHSWTDGSGSICDDCVAKDNAPIKWDPKELHNNSEDKHYMVRFLPYLELADGSSVEPIIGYPNPNKGYGYGSWEECFASLSDAEERMNFLIVSGTVEKIEIAHYPKRNSFAHVILKTWDEKD